MRVLLAGLLILSYGITFPELPLLHDHPFLESPSAPLAFEQGTENYGTSSNSVECIACTRLNTGQVVISHLVGLSCNLPCAVLTLVEDPESCASPIHSHRRDRAPPSIVA